MIDVGISYRTEIPEFMLELKEEELVTCFEIVPDGFALVNSGRDILHQIIDEMDLPYCFHFVGFSPGSADFKLDQENKKKVQIANEFNPLWCSDHMTFQKAGDIDFEGNLVTPRTDEMLEVYIDNIRTIQANIDHPFLLENIPIQWEYRESTMGHAEFLTQIVEQVDCGILLDVHNLYTDSLNYGFDAQEFIMQIPRERVKEIHVAGGEPYKSIYRDGHCKEMAKGDFEILDFALQHTQPEALIMERESRLEQNIGRVKTDLKKVNRLCRQNGHAKK